MLLPGQSGIGTRLTVAKSCVEAMNTTRIGNAESSRPAAIIACVTAFSTGVRSIIFRS
jgi:hypothetical protein